MNRFYFHLSCKKRHIRDTKGRELSDLAAAHRHAMLLIHKMALLNDVDWRGWSITVTDARNQSLLSVVFPQLSYFPDGKKTGQLNRDANR